jgi:hypothetical protein
MTIALPHDAHVVAAHSLFRASGFTIAAMQFPRSADALLALKRFNGLPDDAPAPFPWHFHPNVWCARRWAETGRLA